MPPRLCKRLFVNFLIAAALAPFIGLIVDALFWIFGIPLRSLNWTDAGDTGAFLFAWIFIGGFLIWVAALISE